MANEAGSNLSPAPGGASIELLDAGGGRRLERFGARIIDRPAPAAVDLPRAPATAWATADLRYDGGSWTGRVAIEPWTVAIDGLTLELRPTPSGGVGLFPEQLPNVAWLEARIAERTEIDGRPPEVDERPPEILNLFAHTGLLTLAAARLGARVVHVDGSRPAVAWARRNAELSGLADRPIRWLVDDALGFVARERRRGRRYAGVILDPPSYGGSGSRRWRLVEDLPQLLEACAAVAADGAFVLLTAHTAGLDGLTLGERAASAFERRPEVIRRTLRAESGASLELGWAVRLGGWAVPAGPYQLGG
jgi:23S rRNA (cytosine1962-C5)-methyltransferase